MADRPIEDYEIVRIDNDTIRRKDNGELYAVSGSSSGGVTETELSSIAEKYNGKYQLQQNATILSGQGNKARLDTWINTKADLSYVNDNINSLRNSIDENSFNIIDIKGDMKKKQDLLVSGTNIKTINGQSILGSGDIVIPAQQKDFVTPWKITSNTNDANLINANYGQRQICLNNGNPVIWIGDDVRFTYNSDSGEAVTLQYGTDGKLLYGARSSLAEVLTEGEYTSLTTTEKTLLGAINELNTKLNKVITAYNNLIKGQ